MTHAEFYQLGLAYKAAYVAHYEFIVANMKVLSVKTKANKPLREMRDSLRAKRDRRNGELTMAAITLTEQPADKLVDNRATLSDALREISNITDSADKTALYELQDKIGQIQDVLRSLNQ